MVDNLLFHDLRLIVLLWLGIILYVRVGTKPIRSLPNHTQASHAAPEALPRRPQAVSWPHPQTPLSRL